MQVCTSSQTATPTSHHSVFYRPDALPDAQPTASKHWRNCTSLTGYTEYTQTKINAEIISADSEQPTGLIGLKSRVKDNSKDKLQLNQKIATEKNNKWVCTSRWHLVNVHVLKIFWLCYSKQAHVRDGKSEMLNAEKKLFQTSYCPEVWRCKLTLAATSASTLSAVHRNINHHQPTFTRINFSQHLQNVVRHD